MAYYYIKLYHELLDDPKMGKLPDHLWRRVVELFLIASDTADRDGYLPDIDAIAWKLRATNDEILTDLEAIEPSGIIRQVAGRWYVTNFVKRQAPVSDAERMKRYREREKVSNEPSNDTVTDRNIELKLKIESESENRGTTAAAAACFQAYTKNIGIIPAMVSDAINAELTEGTPPDWIIAAIGEAAKNNVRNWAYIQAILNRWRVEGRGDKRRKKGEPPTADDWRSIESGEIDEPEPEPEPDEWQKTVRQLQNSMDRNLFEKLSNTKSIGWDGDNYRVQANGSSQLLNSRLGSMAARALAGITAKRVDKVIFTEAQ